MNAVVKSLIVACVLAVFATGCAADPAEAPATNAGTAGTAEFAAGASAGTLLDGGGWSRATTEDGLCDVAWRADAGEVPRNVAFGLEVWLLRDGQPLAGPRLELRARMPEHGHGLVREPTVTDQGHGRYRVDNLLLHMRGLWQLDFAVTEGLVGDRARFELTL